MDKLWNTYARTVRQCTVILVAVTGGQGSSLVGGARRGLSPAHSRGPGRGAPTPSRRGQRRVGIGQLRGKLAPCSRGRRGHDCTLVVRGIGRRVWAQCRGSRTQAAPLTWGTVDVAWRTKFNIKHQNGIFEMGLYYVSLT